MGGAECGVVSVRTKMPPVLGGIAANDMSLRSGCFETIVFQYFRSDASLDKCIYLSDQTRIIDNVVLAALKGVVFIRPFGRLPRASSRTPDLHYFDSGREAGCKNPVRTRRADRVSEPEVRHLQNSWVVEAEPDG